MRYYNLLLLSGLLALSTACTSREPSEVQWRGQSFREVRTIKSLPLAIQNELGVGRPGIEGIADRGGKFSATCVVYDTATRLRRFVLAGLSSETALVAVERGGYAYYVEVFLIPLASNNAKPKVTWTFPEKPKSLKELIVRLESKQEEATAMTTHAKATFAMKTWDEKPYNETNGLPKLTRAGVAKSYQGDITGEGKLEYLMMYRDDGSASFIGLERMVGSVGGRSGSFVLQHIGTFEGGVATVTLFVVPGSGTGELRGLRGSGGFAVGHQPPYSMTLDYDFE